MLKYSCLGSRLQSTAVQPRPEKPRTGRTDFMQSKKTGERDWTDPVQTVWTAVRTGLWRTLRIMEFDSQSRSPAGISPR